MTEGQKSIDQGKLNEDLYRKYTGNERASWITQAIEDRAFILGSQWETSDKNKLESENKPALPINVTKPARDRVVSQLTENEPRFFAVGRETSDVKSAGDVADLMSYIWDESRGNTKLKKAVGDYVDVGVLALMAYIDPYADWGKGEIKFTDIDPVELYIINSREPDSSDAEHIFTVKYLTKEKILNYYPNFDFDGAQASLEEYPSHTRYSGEDQVLRDSTLDNTYRVIDRYTKVKEKLFHVLDPVSQFEDIFTQEEYIKFSQKSAFIITRPGQPDEYITTELGIKKAEQDYEATGGSFHFMVDPATGEVIRMPGVEHDSELVIKGSTTIINPTTMGELLNQGVIYVDFPLVDRIKRVMSIGGKLYQENTMGKLEDYPIVTAMAHYMRNPYPMSDVRLVKALQEQLNKIDSVILTYNMMLTNLKVFIPEGSQKKSEVQKELSKSGVSVLEYDPADGIPIFVQLSQMSNAFYIQRENIIRQIESIMGAYSFQDGDVSQAPQTKGGTLLLDEMGLRRSASKRRDIEAALNQLARVISQMIPMVYTEEKTIRLVRPNKTEITFNKKEETDDGVQIINDLTSFRYDIKMMSGSMYPSNKIARFETLKDAWINGMIRDPKPVLMQLDIPDLDEILQREDKLSQYEQTMNQLNDEIKNLEGDLQTSNRETIQANQRVIVEKTKTALNKLLNKAEMSVLMGMQRINDKIKETKNAKQNSTSD